MFWGLILKSNKRYSQTVSKTFHLSQACLDTSTCGDEEIQVMLISEDISYILCSLKKKGVTQCNLDLNFAEGDKIAFHSKGNGTVHLTGYLILPDFLDGYPGEESDEDEEEEMEIAKEINTKKKAPTAKNLKISASTEDDEDDELDAEEGSDDNEDDDDEGSDDDDEEEEDDDEEDEDDSDDDEAVEEPKLKMPKLDIKPKTNGLDKSKDLKQEKNKNKKQNEQKNENATPAAGPKTLQGGVHVEELKVGTGPVAKAGKRVGVYYEGRLKQNNKIFDSSKTGPGFKFVLGRGEVIRAWDVGVAGMKLGGKRRITCPPAMAYGAKGSPPAIPPNSTLVFDVEVKNIN